MIKHLLRLVLTPFLLVLCLYAQAQHQHPDAHSQNLRQLVPTVPYLAYDESQKATPGFDEQAARDQAKAQGLEGEDADRYVYRQRQGFMNSQKKRVAQRPQPQPLPTPQTNCLNVDFEQGSLNDWTIVGDGTLTSGAGYDPYGYFPVVSPGGNYSLQLGNTTNPDTSFAYKSFTVNSSNSFFILKFAMVILNYPHPAADAAKVFIRFRDQNDSIIPCPNFQCYFFINPFIPNSPGQSVGLNNFQTGSPGTNILNQSYSTTFCPWTTIGFDLGPYVGQTITLEVENRWCSYDVDWAYCYIDGECSTLNAPVVDIDCGRGIITAPPGQSSYNWAGPAGSNVSTVHTQTLAVHVPGTYTVTGVPFANTPLCINSGINTFTVDFSPSMNFPSADFNYTITPCATTYSVPFVDQSSNNGGPPISNYTWDWGDGSANGSGASATHIFTHGGPKTVKLIIDNGQCTDTVIKTFVFHTAPVAGFIPSDLCVGVAGSYTSTSYSSFLPAGSITNVNWNYGDGSPNGTGNTCTHAYASVGSYTMVLTCTDDNSCKDSIAKVLNIYPNPVPVFSYTNTCINAQPFPFDASASSISVGTNTLYAWSYGDGQTGAGQMASVIYPDAQIFQVGLTVKSDRGCSSSVSHTVEVYPEPLMQISSSSPGCLGDSTHLLAAPMANSGTIQQILWDLNNSITSMEGSGSHAATYYNAPGSHTVSLVAITDRNCIDTLVKPVYINYIPQVNFSADDSMGCAPSHCVVFTDQSTVPSPAQVTQWTWQLNGATVVANTNVNQISCYPNPGNAQTDYYDVGLTVMTDSGCTASLVKHNYISVWPKPHASYVINPTTVSITTPLVSFFNQSSNYVQWWWNFGDNTALDSLQHDPMHFYDTTSAGIYNSTLVVMNQYGCYDTAYVPVILQPGFSFYIPNAFTPNGDGVNDVFTGEGLGIVEYHIRIFDRWGELIFESNDIRQAWDGFYQSEKAKQDVYVWQVEILDAVKQRHDMAGHVSLIR